MDPRLLLANWEAQTHGDLGVRRAALQVLEESRLRHRERIN